MQNPVEPRARPPAVGGVLTGRAYTGGVLGRLARQAGDILDAAEVCIFARDPADSATTIIAAAIGTAEEAVGTRLPADAQLHQHFGAAVELRRDGESLGTLQAGSPGQRFSAGDRRVLQVLAESVAAAVAHASPWHVASMHDPARVISEWFAEEDLCTAQHSHEVAAMALEIGRAVGLRHADLAELHVAALLHDIGKVRVPEEITKKPGPLTIPERAIMAQHPVIAAEALMDVSGFEVVANIARYHHERWDGAGYPDGLSGARIPLASRIIAVADAYNAMVSERPYRGPLTRPQALAELLAGAGSQFDPGVVAQMESALKRKAVA
jgi:putative nucleotidyltransferase with HDIG domain